MTFASNILNEKLSYLLENKHNANMPTAVTPEVDEQLLLKQFSFALSVDENAVFANPKLYHRYLCHRYLKYIQKITLHNSYNPNDHNETVIVELRNLCQIEFNIRNMLRVLPHWRHTVVCGNDNYDMILLMCKKIHPNIRIIKLNTKNISISDYNILLCSASFWEQLSGKTILIHQEDSLIFHSTGLDFFTQFAFVGAPWPATLYPRQYQVGNGGFSLRNRQIMINICRKYDVTKYVPIKEVSTFMKLNSVELLPEDCFFVNIIVKDHIKQQLGIPPPESARMFSSESYNEQKSIGGHAYWLSDPNWKQRIYKHIVKRLYCDTIKLSKLFEHRFGWYMVLKNMYCNDIITADEKSPYLLIDIIEHYFDININIPTNQRPTVPWIGISHYTPTAPSHMKNMTLQTKLFTNRKFTAALSNCMGIICLTKYTHDYIAKNCPVKLPLYQGFHPIAIPDKFFSMDKYTKNNKKYIIQIGQQLRIMHSIYLLPIKSHKKIFLTGTSDFGRINQMLRAEYPDISKLINSVEMAFVDNQTFDEMLSKNIIFAHVYDASANNTVLEAIAYRTPIVINRHPAIAEYLGDKYPLYFDTLDEVNEKFISVDRIQSAHKYLAAIDIKRFSYDNLNNLIIKILHQ